MTRPFSVIKKTTEITIAAVAATTTITTTFDIC